MDESWGVYGKIWNSSLERKGKIKNKQKKRFARQWTLNDDEKEKKSGKEPENFFRFAFLLPFLLLSCGHYHRHHWVWIIPFVLTDYSRIQWCFCFWLLKKKRKIDYKFSCCPRVWVMVFLFSVLKNCCYCFNFLEKMRKLFENNLKKENNMKHSNEWMMI